MNTITLNSETRVSECEETVLNCDATFLYQIECTGMAVENACSRIVVNRRIEFDDRTFYLRV